jgi:APA family basic amino acid/polyamine antiporter
LLCAFWLLYFYGANLTASWFGPFVFDTSELPIITLYGAYIPIFFMLMKKEKELSTFNRFVMPILSVLGCLFMVIAAWLAHGMAAVYYLIVFAVIMLIGVYYRIVEKRNLAN